MSDLNISVTYRGRSLKFSETCTLPFGGICCRKALGGRAYSRPISQYFLEHFRNTESGDAHLRVTNAKYTGGIGSVGRSFLFVDRSLEAMALFLLSGHVLKVARSSGKNTFPVLTGLHFVKQSALHQSAVAFHKNTSFPKIRCVDGSGALKKVGAGDDDPMISIKSLVAENGSRVDGLEKSLLTSTESNTDAIAFGIVTAETTPQTVEFLASEDEVDLDWPTKGLCSIPEAIEAIQQGKFVIAVDDEDRENEGDLIMAASLATREAMAFIVKHGTGIVCFAMKEEDLERLRLPLMVPDKENEEKLLTAFTVSVK